MQNYILLYHKKDGDKKMSPKENMYVVPTQVTFSRD